MRLKQIKLAGFKSFVDPTIVPFPDNLTAIVGPNGCGKSNLIDAVRWVMGESSAKNLRGDSMTDVIFNGSAARKPIGQASIELVFDNSDGTITGEYASFNEISIKRQVNRESQSTYFLNGTSCRRKDITGIFLGTGLGPRSYAIIEQGMISRLIESKPHELRVFIEEAAGISKYKERRKETENRIRHTRDNLDRLTDLREELGRQLAHLQRQAKSAEKYKTFKVEERQLKAELIALKWQGFNEQISGFENNINQMEVELEAKRAVQRTVDSNIEKSREKHIEMTDSFNEVQGRFYGVGAEIARLEQSIKHNIERRQQLKDDLSSLDQAERNALHHIDQDDQQMIRIKDELGQLEPEIARYQQEVDQSTEALQLADNAMQDWQQDWDGFQLVSAAVNQNVQVEQTRIQHSESLLERSKLRLSNYQKELSEISVSPQEEQLKTLSVELKESEAHSTNASLKSQHTREEINKLREQRDTEQQAITKLHRELQQLQGREVTLKALQKAALGTENDDLLKWLDQQGIEQSYLSKKISVDSGWELAVETVLGKHLEALTIDGYSDISAELEKITDLDLQLIDTSVTNQDISSGSILEKITSDCALPQWLNLVYTTDSLSEALAKVNTLNLGESFITEDGFWLGQGWLQVTKSKQSEDSVISREKQLRQVSKDIEKMNLDYQSAEKKLTELRTKLKQLESNWHAEQQSVTKFSRTVADLASKVSSLKTSLQHNQGRWSILTDEIAEIGKQHGLESEKLALSRVSLEKSIDEMAEHTAQKEKLMQSRTECQSKLAHYRDRVRENKDTLHRAALKAETLRAQLNSADTGKQRAASQLSELGERKEQLQSALAEDRTPISDLEAELEVALSKHQKVEAELSESRKSLEDVEHGIRQLDNERHSAEQNVASVRQKLEALRMDWQGIKVRRSNEEEQLKSSKLSVEEIREQLPDEANEQSWEEKLEHIATKIQRLGAINLAAIDEYQSQSERKTYLDSQNEDLCSALDTLESAIRKIDKETRNRFQDTFEKVNKGLQELFPKVFGGGHAYLELTGENLLDTGITVMARPPGKRNSTIHQLSGGEKALTAISLVFSIFQMKPAPFCMLDEVDAPLDDANVTRFCRLVKEMSKTVQFIYISHNQAAIEMAHHLAGVTMHEAGVSRMVSVDLEEATSLAEANA